MNPNLFFARYLTFPVVPEEYNPVDLPSKGLTKAATHYICAPELNFTPEHLNALTVITEKQIINESNH
jgi:hypothetical protein